MKPVYKIGMILLLLIHACGAAQDSTERKNRLSANGYIKNLQSLTFNKNFRELIAGNLLHNRVNLKWRPSLPVTVAAEFRNRLFWGEEVKLNPGFKTLLRNDNELIDMSRLWIDNPGLKFHTNMDRLWFNYQQEKWNLRLGRQRINWGIATTWNPNDIFNTYNFLDFDYEERPGADAIKSQYFLTDFSHIEIVVASGPATIRKTKIATKYFMNKWGYDMQVLAGIYNNRLTAGFGWAGNIGNAGFKGEAQLFGSEKNGDVIFNGTLESDYITKNGWYFNGSFLYCSQGIADTINDWEKIDFTPLPERPMPARWNLLLTTGKEFTPLLSARTSLVYSPKVNLFILFPSLTYSVAENFTADLVWQSFFSELNNRFEAVSHRCFLRVKWNF